jgi:hypothetical protein
MHLIRLTLVLALPALFANCATVVEGNSQSITVQTEPTAAACTLERGGTVVAAVNPTPGTARIEKSTRGITVICRKDGHQEARAELDAEFQPMTLGNVIIGGLVGVVIDAASGAIAKYPGEVALLLPPDAFASAEERDTFYGGVSDRARARWDAKIERQKQNAECLDFARAESCRLAREALEKSRDAELGRLDEQRRQARIAAAGSG